MELLKEENKMSLLILWASPNKDGLTASCAISAEKGAKEVGEKVEVIQLNQKKIDRCLVCGTGYGNCNTEEHTCVLRDDFSDIANTVYNAEKIIFITPVYYGEMSEPMKAFFDRLRRCDAKSGRISGKKGICIAAAGGSGNGAVDCLMQMNKYMNNVGIEVKDRIPVIKFSKDYMLKAIESATKKLCED